jgi:hypothetical protein
MQRVRHISRALKKAAPISVLQRIEGLLTNLRQRRWLLARLCAGMKIQNTVNGLLISVVEHPCTYVQRKLQNLHGLKQS